MAQVDEGMQHDFSTIDPGPMYAEYRRRKIQAKLVSKGIRVFRVFAKESWQDLANVGRESQAYLTAEVRGFIERPIDVLLEGLDEGFLRVGLPVKLVEDERKEGGNVNRGKRQESLVE